MRVRVPTDKVMDLLEEYKKEYGDLNVPYRFCTVDGIKLGIIVSNIRGGVRKVTVEQKTRLDELGFVWDVVTKLSFEEVIEMLKEYKREHGDLIVPQKYCTACGVKLGLIVARIRHNGNSLAFEKKVKLNELGFVWECHMKYSFAKVIELLEEYKKEYGNLLVPAKYYTADGMKLGSIVRNIRLGARKTTSEQKAKLNQLGFVWKVRKRKRSNREANNLKQN